MNVVDNLKNVESKIAEVFVKYRINPVQKLPKIIAVSKTRSTDEITQLLDSGHRIFGENRIQEAENKWVTLKEEYNNVELHLIGRLQTNKVKNAVAIFDVIETIDREKLAIAVAKEMKKSGKTVDCFIQVNTGEEQQKSGIFPDKADEFIRFCTHDIGIAINGLMCIPPASCEPSLHFGLLSAIAKRNGISELSMGMSADYEIASAMGADYVRVGTGIFGGRSYD